MQNSSAAPAAKKDGRSRKGLRYLRNLAVFAAGTLLAGLCITFYGILPAVYAHSRSHPLRLPVCCATPADYDIPYEEISFFSEGGILLRGWYIRSQNGAAVILAHGIGGNREGLVEQGVFLARQGFGVLLLDLRAHGESGGETITFGGADLRAGVEFLTGQEDVDHGKIGAWGFSLGGLQAIQAAAGMEEIAAVVADGAAPNQFADIPAPESLTYWLDTPFQWVVHQIWKFDGIPGPLAATEALKRIAPRPVLLIAGTAGDYERDMQRKFHAASGAGCELWEVPEAGHNEAWGKRNSEYKQRVLSFFAGSLLS